MLARLALSEQSKGMFTLAGQHVFEPDPSQCLLYASWGCDSAPGLQWTLRLNSKTSPISIGSVTEWGSFGIYARPSLVVSDWRELPSTYVILPESRLRCGFRLHFDSISQWDDLLSLRLDFGAINGTEIEVIADGFGSVEAFTEFFPDEKVEFQIRTSARFNGIGINVPLDTSDPTRFATNKIRELLPGYSFLPPVLRRTETKMGFANELTFSPSAG